MRRRPSSRLHGIIQYEFNVDCGRCTTDQPLGTVTHADSKKEAGRLGWKYTKDLGWLCPRCAAALTKGETE